MFNDDYHANESNKEIVLSSLYHYRSDLERRIASIITIHFFSKIYESYKFREMIERYIAITFHNSTENDSLNYFIENFFTNPNGITFQEINYTYLFESKLNYEYYMMPIDAIIEYSSKRTSFSSSLSEITHKFKMKFIEKRLPNENYNLMDGIVKSIYIICNDPEKLLKLDKSLVKQYKNKLIYNWEVIIDKLCNNENFLQQILSLTKNNYLIKDHYEWSSYFTQMDKKNKLIVANDDQEIIKTKITIEPTNKFMNEMFKKYVL